MQTASPQWILFRSVWAFFLFGTLAMAPARAESPVPPPPAEPAQTALLEDGIWHFAIERGGYRIGDHILTFDREGPQLVVTTRSRALVSLLGIPVYRLELDAREVWRDGQFVSYDAAMNDNGRRRVLKVEAFADKTLLTVNGKPRELAPGLMPATFWNLALTRQAIVIDPIKGRLRNVTFSDRGLQNVDLPNRTVKAHRFTMAGELKRDIWYAADGSVVRMDGIAKDGSLVKGFRE